MKTPVRKYACRLLGFVVVLAACLWTIDWLRLRHNIAAGDSGFGSVEVHRRFEIRLKNRQTEQRVEKPHPESCVGSIFPHYNETPCWYLARHANDVQELDGGSYHFWEDDRR
jgi:hypothetical protein